LAEQNGCPILTKVTETATSSYCCNTLEFETGPPVIKPAASRS